MRLFVAVEIPSAVRENLVALIEELRAASTAAKPNMRPRWAPADNLHVTLKFIGNVDEDMASRIREELKRVRTEAPVDLQVSGLGFFPGEKRPAVLWAGIQTSTNLPPLVSDIEIRLEKFGVAREKREFKPHLTLARFNPPGISDELRAAVHANSSREFGATRTGEFHLFESKTRPTGAVYTCLESFTFTKAEE